MRRLDWKVRGSGARLNWTPPHGLAGVLREVRRSTGGGERGGGGGGGGSGSQVEARRFVRPSRCVARVRTLVEKETMNPSVRVASPSVTPLFSVFAVLSRRPLPLTIPGE